MRNKLGNLLIVLGCLMLAGAVAVYAHNQKEQLDAAVASSEAIPKLVEAIKEHKLEPEEELNYELISRLEKNNDAPLPTMRVEMIDGYGYIGFVGIPSLELELPVMSEWSYPQMQMTPCRYSGSTYGKDLVLVAHNYDRHFGKIKDLPIGSVVTFTDMNGETGEYEVIAIEVLSAAAVEEMVSGEYDLTLFTCTYGGQSRVTVRCDRLI